MSSALLFWLNVIANGPSHSPDHALNGAQTFGFGLAGKGAIGAERHGERRAREVHHTSAFRAQCGFEQELRRIVRRT